MGRPAGDESRAPAEGKSPQLSVSGASVRGKGIGRDLQAVSDLSESFWPRRRLGCRVKRDRREVEPSVVLRASFRPTPSFELATVPYFLPLPS